MKKRGLTDSFNYAIQGLKHTLKTQRNMRIHFVIGAAVIILGLVVGLSPVEFILLLSAITLVIVAEMFNTALELAVDMFTKEFHHMAKLAKDIAAGCVFVTSVYAVVVGYLIFFRPVKLLDLSEGISRIRESPWHITFIALVTVISAVIIIKILLRRGTPLRGGWPSGHSALGFSVFTVITLLSQNGVISALAFLLALLLAISRVRKGLHTAWEAIAGSVIGILATLLIFKLLYLG
ncbi:MAG: diacylglycerol kinase [Candidatus Omnitrophica bacterium]|nr:diacylglycerol kinase [Candidatus Omnitrophota bacterium]